MCGIVGILDPAGQASTLRERALEMARAVRPGGRIAITDMRRHTRTAYRDTMGHAHLGFAAEDIERALPGQLALLRYTELPPDPDVRGPALFAAVVVRR